MRPIKITRVHFVFAVICIMYCHGNTQSGGELSPEKLLIQSLFLDAWNDQDFSVLEASTSGADTMTLHVHGQSMQTHFEELKGLVAFWKRSFPDLKFEIHHMIQEKDMVAVNLTYTATHSGDWWGIPPSGNKISVAEMMFFRFDNGRLIEAWETYDEAGQRRQMEKR